MARQSERVDVVVIGAGAAGLAAAAMIGAYGAEAEAEAFFAAHPRLLSKVMLRLFYSRARIMSREAREGWAKPDLAPLPRVMGGGGRPEEASGCGSLGR